MTQNSAFLFGKPYFLNEGTKLSFKADMRFQLLAYLACQKDWVSREKVAFLFWSDVSTTKSKKNLRDLLQRVKKLNLSIPVESDAQQLKWPVSSDYIAFESGIGAAHISTALNQYSGAFLQGLETTEAAEFNAWLEDERERLASTWQQLSFEQAHLDAERGNYASALNHLAAVLKQDALNEEATQLYMSIATQAGKPKEALRAYEQLQKRLSTELDLPAPIELEQFANRIRERQASSLVEQSRQPVVAAVSVDLPLEREGLPKPSTPFIGRDLLLADLGFRLSQTDQQLISLLGLGGMGKTRLAIEAAYEHERHFKDGVFFVSLVTVASESALVTEIASALGFLLDQGLLSELASAISDKHLLLVLDNAEHLVSKMSGLSELLSDCPNLKLLVTSRERLNLAAEHVLPVVGMPVPDMSLAKEAFESFDAVTLFLFHAKRVNPNFELTEENAPYLNKICELVEGSPLGIELASGWVRMIPLEEIAKEITQDSDFLRNETQDLEERHQSIRAVFEYSWRLLSQAEQAALKQLSVVRGGFTREAAKQAFGIALPVLASLVDKSLLEVSSSGRYLRHLLLYQYMQEKLEASDEEKRAAQENHAQYYLRFLHNWGQALNSETQDEALSYLSSEFENIRTAWFWALEHNLIRLRHVAGFLHTYYDIKAFYSSAILLSNNLEQLEVHTEEEQAALAAILFERTWILQRLGKFEEAVASITQALDLLKHIHEPKLQTTSLRLRAILAYQQGQLEQTKSYLLEALNIAQKNKDKHFVSTCLANIAITEEMLGNFEAAESYHKRTIDMDRRLQSPSQLTHSLSNYGNFLREQGKLGPSEKILKEALIVSRKHKINKMLPYILAGLGGISYQNQSFGKAEEYFKEGLQEARESAETAIISEILILWAFLKNAQEDFETARSFLIEGLELSWDAQEMPRVMYCLIAWAEYLIKQNKNARAQQLLELSLNHSATRGLNKPLIHKLLKEVGLSKTETNQTEQNKPELSKSELEPIIHELLYLG